MRTRLRLLLAALAALVAVPWAAAEAQSDPTAAEVAAWVERFYDQSPSMSARFTQRYRHRVQQRTTTSRGRVRFRRPGMLRFDYDSPNGKVVVSDGENLVVYEPPDDGESRGQYFQQEVADADLPAALGFLTGTTSFTTHYRLRLLDADRLSYSGQILELRSRRPSPHYSRILLFVDDQPQSRGVIQRIVIVDHQNNQNRFDFTDQSHSTPVPERVFQYRPPSGARRVQP